MSTHIQLIGSIVIAGTFLLGILRFHGGVVDFSNRNLFQLLTQETAASFMEIIDHDLRRVGTALPPGQQAILDTTELTFLGDVNEDGVADTVRYYTSLVGAASATPNPNDVILYREVNSVNTIASQAGVAEFTVEILDEQGVVTTDLLDVRMLQVSLRVESKEPYDEEYSVAVWEKLITPLNLNRETFTDF